MNTAAKRTTERDRTTWPEPPVSEALSDRIQADGEQVAHTLNPGREPDTVVYPDPQAPRTDHKPSLAPQSNAEIQMARRTDAGQRAAATDWNSGDSSTVLFWGAGAVGVLLVMAVLIGIT